MLELDDSIGRIARGTSIAIVGVATGLVFNFSARLIIARYSLQAEYGIFSLSLAILNVAMLLATLGFRQGATRYIAFSRGRDDAAGVRGTISASLRLTIAAGSCVGIAIFFAADTIATGIFHTSDLAIALKIFALSVPFFALINVLAAVFRGFDRIEPQVYFEYIMLNMLFLLLLAVIVSIGLPFITILYAYLASLVVTFAVFAVFSIRKLPQMAGSLEMKRASPVTKDLLLFSLPLLGAVILTGVMNWINTLMLGHFRTPEAVGLYNAAHPLAQFIAEPLVALLLIYTPIATGLYSRNRMSELRRDYTVLVKWLMVITLPIFLVLFLFPEAVIRLFFGAGYVEAGTALRVLSFGFIIGNLSGPNRGTLVALGHARFLMWTTLAAVLLNVVLNIFLIPLLGIVGAAIAFATSIILTNVVRSARVYLLCHANPLSRNLLKPAVVCVLLAFVIQGIAQSFLTITWWLLLVLFVVYVGIYGIATLLTKSLDREDIALLLEIEKRTGINTGPLKRILRRFV